MVRFLIENKSQLSINLRIYKKLHPCFTFSVHSSDHPGGALPAKSSSCCNGLALIHILHGKDVVGVARLGRYLALLAFADTE